MSEGELASMMVGRQVRLTVDKQPATPGEVVLDVEDLRYVDPAGVVQVDGVSLQVRAGEIVALAGVQGNGQTELTECCSASRPPSEGRTSFKGRDVTHLTIDQRLALGIGYVPEDRMHDGLVGGFTVAENLVLDLYDQPPFARGLMLDLRRDRTQRRPAGRGVRRPYAVRGQHGGHAVRRQPAEGRARARAVPTARPARRRSADPRARRGLDGVRAPANRAERDQGSAVLLLSTELEEILGLADRILVMYRGKVIGELAAADATAEQVGLLMAGSAVTATRVEDVRSGGRAALRPDEPARPSGAGCARRNPVVVTVLSLFSALVVGGLLIAITDDRTRHATSYFFSYPWDTFIFGWEAVWEAYKALFEGAIFNPSIAVQRQLHPDHVAALGDAGHGDAAHPRRAFPSGSPSAPDCSTSAARARSSWARSSPGYVGFAWKLPPGLHLLVALIAGVLGGALWGGLAGWLKARTGAHEVITTIMLNYIALYFLQYLLSVRGFQRPGSNQAISKIVHPSARLPHLLGSDLRVHAGLLVASSRLRRESPGC